MKEKFINLSNYLISSFSIMGEMIKNINYKPQNYLVQLKKQLNDVGAITNSWMNCNLQEQNIQGQIFLGYPGELTIENHHQIIRYQFFIIPKNNKVLLKKIEE